MLTLVLNYYIFDPVGHILRSIVSGFRSSFPGKSQWDVDETPDLHGNVVIVTGGNAGIGRETCKVRMVPSHSVRSLTHVLGTFEKERQGLSCCKR